MGTLHWRGRGLCEERRSSARSAFHHLLRLSLPHCRCASHTGGHSLWFLLRLSARSRKKTRAFYLNLRWFHYLPLQLRFLCLHVGLFSYLPCHGRSHYTTFLPWV